LAFQPLPQTVMPLPTAVTYFLLVCIPLHLRSALFGPSFGPSFGSTHPLLQATLFVFQEW
jgi:hypothetical protein